MKYVFSLLIFLTIAISARAQFSNYRVSSVSAYQPEEVTITIDPTNPSRLAAGSNLNYYYYSTDGGINWYTGTLTCSLGVYGDPCVRFDKAGNLFYGHLRGFGWNDSIFLDRIIVQKSTDGGITWNDGAWAGFHPPKDQDKEWITIDITNSIYQNNLYMCWTEFDRYPINGISYPYERSRILFSKSTDMGISWSETITLSDFEGNCWDDDSTVEGAVPAVGPNGEIYTSWSGPLGIMFDKSTDGGLTFGQDIYVTDQPGGWALDVPGIMRCNGMPVTGCDVSDSPYRGRIYILWSDQRNGANNTDVFLIKSTDGGNNWYGRIRVNNDTTQTHQFFPWMTVDPVTGFIYAVFYDRRDTTNDYTHVYMAVSRDGGDTFENFKISETSFKPLGGIFFGDYIDIAAYNRKVHPIWMRMDGSTLSVWTMKYEDTTEVISAGDISKNPRYTALYQNYPNPFNPETQIDFDLPSASPVRIGVYNLLGQRVKTLINESRPAGHHSVYWNGKNESGGAVAGGIYIYRIEAGSWTQSKKMILMK